MSRQNQSPSQRWTGLAGRGRWDRAWLEQAARQLARATAAAAQTGIELGEAAAVWGGARGAGGAWTGAGKSWSSQRARSQTQRTIPVRTDPRS